MLDKNYVLSLFEKCKIQDDFSEDNWENFVYQLPEPLDCHQYIYTGVSKLVFVLPGADYVIKIPFKGNYDRYSYYDSDGDWVGIRETFYEYEYANNYRDWDYCLSETIYYNAAKKAGVHKAFAKTKCIGCANDYPIYIQERATMLHSAENTRSHSKEELDKTREYCKNKSFRTFNLEWQTDALNYYGKAMFDKILNFLKEYGIHDLHSGNLGYIDNRPVIVDYSDYRD